MPAPGRTVAVSSLIVRDRWAKTLHPSGVVAGGSPWRLARLRGTAAELWRRLDAAGRTGVTEVGPELSGAARALVSRGLAHPVPRTPTSGVEVTIVVPAYGRTESLERTLLAVGGCHVIVVDDGSPDPSPIRNLSERYGATLVRLDINRGPAAARNAGARAARTELVAFVDSDCQPRPGWLELLAAHFTDPQVAIVAPRIVPTDDYGQLLARYERAASALDMGRDPALVRPGARLGFVPSAALLVRSRALEEIPFDERLRLGEDVDLVWRLADAGWAVRYEPAAIVIHETRTSWRAWARRRFEYGTSAADLDSRHPGRLAPLRGSPWNFAALGLVALGQPVLAAGVAASAGVLLARRLAALGIPPSVAARLVAMGVAADAVSAGHALRREYWPIGLLALTTAPRFRVSRVAATVMLAPIAADWIRTRPSLDPLRYTAMRLLADASYGSGVLLSSITARALGPVRPRLRQHAAPASRRTR